MRAVNTNNSAQNPGADPLVLTLNIIKQLVAEVPRPSGLLPLAARIVPIPEAPLRVGVPVGGLRSPGLLRQRGLRAL